MAERDVAEELEDRLDNTGAMPDEPAEEPDLEDAPTGDPDQPDDDEPGPDDLDEPDADDSPVDAQPRRRQSAQDRIQESRRQVATERAAREAAEARAAAAEQRNNAATAHAEEQREQAILDGLDEQGRTQYLMAKALKQTQEGQARIERQLSDTADRADFAARAAKDQRRAKLLDRVENAARHAPPGTKREHIYWTLLGKAIDEGSLEAGAKQRQAAGKRVAAQRAPAGRARSDAAPRARRGSDLASRMEADDPAI